MDVFYKQNWASNVKLISFYMVYGCVCFRASLDAHDMDPDNTYSSGTSWGGLPYPGVYTRCAHHHALAGK